MCICDNCAVFTFPKYNKLILGGKALISYQDAQVDFSIAVCTWIKTSSHVMLLNYIMQQVLARLDESQEELLYYPVVGVGVNGGGGVSKMLKVLR